MPFSAEQIDRFSKRFAILEPYYAIHGSGALCWHLKHRMVDELDFFIKPGARDEQFDSAMFTAISKLLPIEQTMALVADTSRFGVLKIPMSNITLSFIQTPKFNGTHKRANEPGAMAIASLDEAIGGKFYALGLRESDSDFVDISAILRHQPSLTPAEIMVLTDRIQLGDAHHFAAFEKLHEIDWIEGLGEKELEELHDFGAQGIELLGNPQGVAS